ncbi:hypothetical protein ACYCSE_17325 [Paenibacillus sp. SEL1]
MTLNQYRKIADKVGGEVGETIHELVEELEEAREVIRGNKIPPLLGSKEVAEYLEVDPKNMHHTRKTRFFPEPDLLVGTRPFWFKTTIQMYQDKLAEWRESNAK